MRPLTPQQQVTLRQWYRETGEQGHRVTARVTHADPYGNPVITIKDCPPCRWCNPHEQAECDQCDGYGHMSRIRQFTVMPSGSFIEPLGGIVNATELTSVEVAGWLEGVVAV
jgi:hypothetical protein